jgi:hypothetical protein
MQRNYPGYQLPDNFVHSKHGKWIEITMRLVIQNVRDIREFSTLFYLTPGTKLKEVQEILMAVIENIGKEKFENAIMDHVYIDDFSFGVNGDVWELLSYMSQKVRTYANTLPEELYDILDSIDIRMTTFDENANFDFNFDFDRLVD